MIDNLFALLPPNVLAGMGTALLSVVVGTRISVGWRNYVLIVVAALLVTAAVIENFLASSRLITCCLVGFGVGWVADDVVMTLNATLPAFVKDSVSEVFDTAGAWVKKILDKYR